MIRRRTRKAGINLGIKIDTRDERDVGGRKEKEKKRTEIEGTRSMIWFRFMMFCVCSPRSVEDILYDSRVPMAGPKLT
jgi:hypothetical protein